MGIHLGEKEIYSSSDYPASVDVRGPHYYDGGDISCAISLYIVLKLLSMSVCFSMRVGHETKRGTKEKAESANDRTKDVSLLAITSNEAHH